MTHHRLIVSSTLALTASLAAQHLREIEPNNTVAQAQTLVAASQVAANLVAGEQDSYTFTLAGAAEVHLRTAGNFSINPSMNAVVFLFDATGTNRLAWNDDAGKRSRCCFLQKPLTCSTPARLYQLQSKITTLPPAGK